MIVKIKKQNGTINNPRKLSQNDIIEKNFLDEVDKYVASIASTRLKDDLVDAYATLIGAHLVREADLLIDMLNFGHKLQSINN